MAGQERWRGEEERHSLPATLWALPVLYSALNSARNATGEQQEESREEEEKEEEEEEEEEVEEEEGDN